MLEMQDRAEVAESRPSRRRPPRRRPALSVPDPPPPKDPSGGREEERQSITAHVERGIEALNQTASRLLRDVARETWKASRSRPHETPTDTAPGPVDALRRVLLAESERHRSLEARLHRIEGAIHQLARVQREAASSQDPGVARTLLQRMGELHDAVRRDGGRRDLQAFAVRVQGGLSGVARALREDLAAASERQEALLEQGLAALRTEIRDEFRQAIRAVQTVPAPDPWPRAASMSTEVDRRSQIPPISAGARGRPSAPRLGDAEARLARVADQLDAASEP